MNIELSEKDCDLDFYEKNISSLKEHSPEIARMVIASKLSPQLTVKRSNDGYPIILDRGVPLDDTINPVSTSVNNFEGLKSNNRSRFFIFGLGMYQLIPIISDGFSVSVYEPNISVLKLALTLMDFTPLIPFITFYIGDKFPDLPRDVQIIINKGTEQLYPNNLTEFKKPYIDHLPPQGVDFDTGVYYGAYRNVTCLKNPMDLFIYNMIIFELRPTLILEIGACRGGSALYFADLLNILGGDRRIHTYDIFKPSTPELYDHPRITFHDGGHNDFNPNIIKPSDRVLVIEDSSHEYKNTLEVIRKFSPYVSKNSYLIVEDGAAGATRPHLNGGPIKAIEEFMLETKDYVIDSHLENFYGPSSSACLKGFLKRIN